MDCILVDDSAFVRKILKDAITRLNHNVVGVYKDGKSLLEEIENLHYDLIFLDIILPNITGIEVLTEILKINPRAKVVMLSGLAQSNILSVLLDKGAIDFITKPFQEEKLRDFFINFESSIHAPKAESLSKVELACFVTNIFIKELIIHSNNMLSQVIRSQVEVLLQELLQSETFEIDMNSLSLSIRRDAWETSDEDTIYQSINDLIDNLRLELEFVFSDSVVADVFQSTFKTIFNKPRLREAYSLLKDSKLNLPEPRSIEVNLDEFYDALKGGSAEDMIAVSAFSLTSMGPELIFHVYEKVIEEMIAFKSSIFYYTVVSQGSANFSGLFGPLPVSTNEAETTSLFSAIVYIQDMYDDVIEEDGKLMIVIFYKPAFEHVLTDYNKISFIIKARLLNSTTRESYQKAQIAGIRDDIIKLYLD